MQIFFHVIYILCAELVFPEVYFDQILPGDNLVVALKSRSHLTLGVEDSIVVLENGLNDTERNPSLKDPVLSVSLRRLDPLFFEIYIDGRIICSFGLFKDVAECSVDQGGDSRFLLRGTANGFTIEGYGGCLTEYPPKENDEGFKHGVRIDFCDDKDNQIWYIKKSLI
ncbi:hypothetical protein EDEG_01872 [Edhazardia aedis USNM 41457]|uniref:Ricin B lectin domain-containing protein n=1 Tax=Edhazardia aedis (strain USNM 41457) TaxID=1003232 RepID=J9D7R0_EDHAE|nr:hypothetical protein EDEG_01872 [Edhazardia aedis USNM 41457]|eukprot:EJW03836.1 hypothetical protein EDEG_01872 [Edhazardia aedis USNM 41457]